MYKTTYHILNNPLEKKYSNNYFPYPIHSENTEEKILHLNDIELWEEIYYYPGFIGIYISHIPHVEYYMVTYNFFLDKEKSYEIFYGENGKNKVLEIANKLNIPIEISILQVN